MAKKNIGRSAKKSTGRRNVSNIGGESISSGRRSSGGSASLSQGEHRDFKEIIREFASNPAVKYVAGGIATAMLSKVVSSLSGRYPELSRLLNENLENFEGKLREFRGGESSLDTQH